MVFRSFENESKPVFPRFLFLFGNDFPKVRAVSCRNEEDRFLNINCIKAAFKRTAFFTSNANSAIENYR
ncbi:hypothetical protein LEP1GSC036_2391 [Leptospira weilii str. 2006001853]|uniref:Uncharacterized protein n=1 Tax=Leptospira weilii str. 2006001853 TaxID=1001589 RepID=A0A828YVS4_9LEPT|nr:hypothetical protein LEP1GSC036_2391 [Leptospira weilii str. 2006001853]EMJ65628.1 hypothetical protein LEP1GSC051_1324 [Leptospira sp. P2653]EMN45196.1 hypothetical protein LEP1GSC086_1281 [Leptospira weilii str. LNT 1234]QDK23173.1 hypothetical protein FHG67_10945 [Leptospira weilii]QDK27189.1 hypothetical protein FHG68_11310 [Leptospira weilii]